MKKLKGRRVDRTQHADGVKALPVDGNETDQANVVYRRPDGDSGPTRTSRNREQPERSQGGRGLMPPGRIRE